MHRSGRRKTYFYREIRAICRWSYQYPALFLVASALLCLPALYEARKIGLDTDLTRLLPQSSPAVRWSEELKPAVGDGGYFAIIFEGDNREALAGAVETAAAEIQQLHNIESVDYRFPFEFIKEYRYLLIPSEHMEEILGLINKWEAEVNPMVIDLGDPGDAQENPETDLEELELLLHQYGSLSDYHEDADGRMFGMIVRSKQGISDLARLRDTYRELGRIVERGAQDNGLSVSIGGSLRNRVDEFDVIVGDLKRSGTVSVIAILIVLAISFRSFIILPVVLYPLANGLLWSFALVPTLVGDLNTITSFLLLVLFGMGVDYSIHLVKRFQAELVSRDPEEALLETFSSTGRSVATSGMTTALGLSILTISDFRGFSDFGAIGGTSMMTVLLAMLAILPAALTAGHKLGLVRSRAPGIRRAGSLMVPGWTTAAIVFLVLLAGIGAIRWLEFDYDFTNLSATVDGKEEIKDKERQIYPGFFGPAAIYVARDLVALDGALAVLEEAKASQTDSPTIGAISSVRNFAPDAGRLQERRRLIEEIKERLGGRWVRRIEDPDKQRIIEDVKMCVPPDQTAKVEELPPSILRNLMARDGSGELVLAVNVTGQTLDGQMSMEFTRDLYELQMPPGVRGPTGDKTVMAEILWLVTTEAPYIVGLTLLGIYLMVVVDRRSLLQAQWVLLPLVAGLLATFGFMIIRGWKLNFFNIVVLPTILGIGVDHGVHYYRRWRELAKNTRATQAELFEPITSCTITTIMGYAGMTFAHHPGLRSIGDLAVVGLVCCWFTALVLLPGTLSLREGQARRHRKAVAGVIDGEPSRQSG